MGVDDEPPTIADSCVRRASCLLWLSVSPILSEFAAQEQQFACRIYVEPSWGGSGKMVVRCLRLVSLNRLRYDANVKFRDLYAERHKLLWETSQFLQSQGEDSTLPVPMGYLAMCCSHFSRLDS